jgi:hypothetical protein
MDSRRAGSVAPPRALLLLSTFVGGLRTIKSRSHGRQISLGSNTTSKLIMINRNSSCGRSTSKTRVLENLVRVSAKFSVLQSGGRASVICSPIESSCSINCRSAAGRKKPGTSVRSIIAPRNRRATFAPSIFR